MKIALNALWLSVLAWPPEREWDFLVVINHLFVDVGLEMPSEPEFYDLMIQLRGQSRTEIMAKLSEVCHA